MGSVGLRPSGGYSSLSAPGHRESALWLEGAVGGLCVPPLSWGPGATPAGIEPCRPYPSFSMESVGLRPSGGYSSLSARDTGSLHFWLEGALSGLRVPPLRWGPGATPARMEPCRPYPSLSMGSVGLRPPGGSTGKAATSNGRLRCLPEGAPSGLACPLPAGHPAPSLAPGASSRPYLSFSMETVGLHHGKRASPGVQ